jgi:hypothetical protein
MLRLFFFLFIGGLSANAASVLACTPEILDVQVLPPLEPNTTHDRHILAIELQHRSQSGCQLLGPTVQLLPESGADTFTNSFFSDQELPKDCSHTRSIRAARQIENHGRAKLIPSELRLVSGQGSRSSKAPLTSCCPCLTLTSTQFRRRAAPC